ncbi:MAG: hypothetical protein IJV39_02980 [Ruminococcus sp.]|nr:hypothetical protein [Ruminococcus sp.]
MRKEFVIKLADKNIGVSCIFDSTYDFCRAYITENKADFNVIVSKDDIDFESMKSARENIAEGHRVICYPDEYLETLALYRKIAEKMPAYNTLLFHGSVIAVDGEGYLFTAKSGTGKSTHTRLWKELFKDRAVMVNDDKPLLKITDSGVFAYGTPWNGKHHLGNNISAPLKVICFLKRAENNSIAPVTKQAVYGELLQQCYRPAKIDSLKKTLVLLDLIAQKVGFYQLFCNQNIEAAEISYHKMKG